MFDTIILLSGPAERVALLHVLRGHNPVMRLVSVTTAAELAALDPELLSCARLIAFVTPEIVPADILARLGYGAINFHPGPPSYPGWAPAHFALYNRDAHLAQLYWRMAGSLVTDPNLPSTRPISWGNKKYTRRAYRAICDIPFDIARDELVRRMQVFGGNHFGIAPTINLHGVEFRAVMPAAEKIPA
jgi:hypothetical protein